MKNTMITFLGAFTLRLRPPLVVAGFALLMGAPNLASAGMTWTARAIDPSLISAMKTDRRLLEDTLFGEAPKAFGEKPKEGKVDFGADRQLSSELEAWAAQRKADDTQVDLDKAWHGIHYLLTGSVDANGTLASKVIMGGESIGPDDIGYGPAQLLKPDEVKAIAQLLEQTTPDMLRKRFKPKEMTRLDVYPGVIWERDGDEALKWVLESYQNLVAFYRRAAYRGQAVIIAIS
jgi:hypothetical protein